MAKVFGPSNFMVCAVMPSRSREESGTDPGVDEYNFSQKFTTVGFVALRMHQELQDLEKGNLLTRDSCVAYKFFFPHGDQREAFADNSWLQSPGLATGRILGAAAVFTRFSPGFLMFTEFLNFTRFSPGFLFVHWVSEFHHVFTRFSPGCWMFTKFLNFTRFSPGFLMFTEFLNFTKFSPGFHQVFCLFTGFLNFRFSPGFWVFTEFLNFTRFSPGFHQVFTKFLNFTRFSPSLYSLCFIYF